MIERTRLAMAQLLIYRNVLDDTVIKSFIDVLDYALEYEANPVNLVNQYGDFTYKLFCEQKSFREHLLELILTDDNPFSFAAGKNDINSMDSKLLLAVKLDLENLQYIYDLDFSSLLSAMGMSTDFSEIIANENRMHADVGLPDLWKDDVKFFADYYRRYCRGVVARHRALRFMGEGRLSGINNPDLPNMNDLLGCDRQKKLICQNTETFLRGLPANNILLYGSRGTGKSSMIKSLIRKYRNTDLRIVELEQKDISAFTVLFDRLADYNAHFIIFIDDLSFEEFETEYKGLKAILEGSLHSQPANVLIYATSNRRHLVREYFSDRVRTGEEIHTMDTLQEKLSLSDRFGLFINFDPPDKQTYLQIVDNIAERYGVQMDQGLLHRRAQEWERGRSGPTGRTAEQFVRSLQR